MIAVIDYGMGNICSLGNTLKRLGADWQLTSEPDVIRKASHIILPGVGNASKAMENLTRLSLTDVVRQSRRPVLGICVG
ncbi:MAG: imidazole glycerol phosphate synthase subunit HisH, partial [Muribaculaceae bacterium]|nr:imidazole glycerol phosphate synthase subunit HisH [Muribaculaceae bacterium]